MVRVEEVPAVSRVPRSARGGARGGAARGGASRFPESAPTRVADEGASRFPAGHFPRVLLANRVAALSGGLLVPPVGQRLGRNVILTGPTLTNETELSDALTEARDAG